MNVGAILLCAGRGERLGRKESKALLPIAGRPLFAWSLEALQNAQAVQGIVVVGPVKALRGALGEWSEQRILAWCEGGRERQDSVARGLAALPPEFDLVLVHDCARPLVTADLIARVAGEAMTCGAAIAAVPLEDTLKRTSLQVIEQTVPRAGLWRAQTPQAFRRDWFARAHAEAHGTATDDAALVEALGERVKIVEGEATNFKITRPQDVELAEAWLELRRART